MKFEDVFPYDKSEFSFVIDFFEKYTEYTDFAVSFSEWAQGITCPVIEFAGIDLPCGDDQRMQCGPRIWEGPSFFMSEQELDFHQFAVIMLTAVRVFLENMKEKGITEYSRRINLVDNSEHIYTETRFLGDIEKFREKFLDVQWIKENCYGEDDVSDDHGVLTGEHHGKEWGEEWYEKYGKYLNFDDVDRIIEESFAAYYEREKGVKKC